MVCSSEVRAAAAIAEDVGFDSLPCPPFSDSFRNWCPHHYWAYENLLLLLLLLLLLKIWGYLVQNLEQKDKLLVQYGQYTSKKNGAICKVYLPGFVIKCC